MRLLILLLNIYTVYSEVCLGTQRTQDTFLHTMYAKYGGNTCTSPSDCETKCTPGCDGYSQIPSGTVVLQVSAGYDFSCSLSSDGVVNCWGYNNYGQLGDGTTSTRSTPVTPTLESAAVSVHCGYSHTCALLDTGKVQCWGRNHAGQLGIDSTGTQKTPQTVLNIEGVTQLAVGGNENCVLFGTGEVKCWGWNNVGQLGIGSTANQGDGAGEMAGLAFTDLGGPAKHVECGRISSAGSHCCAIMTNDDLKCWGYNNVGQLGVGSTANQGDGANEMGSNLQVTMSNVMKVALGESTTCAITTTLQVHCWGREGYTGYDDTTRRTSPGPALLLGKDAVDISTGYRYACAIFIDGSAKCWGNNDHGKLGQGVSNGHQGDGSNEMAALSFIDLSGTGSEAWMIGTGQRHTCAVIDGKVACWGLSHIGQAGGSTCNYECYKPEGNIDYGYGAVTYTYAYGSKETGAGLSKQLTDICAPCVANEYVQQEYQEGSYSVGAGQTSYTCNTLAECEPQCSGDANCVGYTEDKGLKAVKFGRGSTFHQSVLFNDGSVRCIATNGYQDRCGTDDESTLYNINDPSTWGLTKLSGPAIDVADVDRGGCALMEDGSLECWMDTTMQWFVFVNPTANGKVGANPDYPMEQHRALDTGSYRFKNISGANEGICGILKGADEGKVACWGYFGYRGGHGTGYSSPTAQYYPLQIMDFGSPVVDLSCGHQHCCFLISAYVQNTNKYGSTSCADSADCETKCDADATCDGYTSGGGTITLTASTTTGKFDWFDMSVDGTKRVAAHGYWGGEIYVSTDSGATWNTKTDAATGNGGWTSVSMTTDGSKIFACYSGQAGGYLSTDSGETWTNFDTGHVVYFHKCKISGDGTKLVSAASGFSGEIWISTDDGATWSESNSNAKNWNDVAISSDGTKIVAAESANIWYSHDGGATWSQSVLTYITTLSYIAMSSDGMKIVGVVGGSKPIRYSHDGGITWAEETGTHSTATNYKGVDISADGTVAVATAYNENLHISTDGGVTWTMDPAANYGANWRRIAISPDKTKILTGGYDLAIYNGEISYSMEYGPLIAGSGTSFAPGASVKCFGDNSIGQLGIGSTTDVEFVNMVESVDIGTHVPAKIFCGRKTTHVITTTGDLIGWGGNPQHELGYNDADYAFGTNQGDAAGEMGANLVVTMTNVRDMGGRVCNINALVTNDDIMYTTTNVAQTPSWGQRATNVNFVGTNGGCYGPTYFYVKNDGVFGGKDASENPVYATLNMKNMGLTCIACAGGTYNRPGDVSVGTCDDDETCNANFYSDGTQCVACPTGTTSVGAAVIDGKSYCKRNAPCGVDEYVTEDSVCGICPFGQFSDATAIEYTATPCTKPAGTCGENEHSSIQFVSADTRYFGNTCTNCETDCINDASCLGYTPGNKIISITGYYHFGCSASSEGVKCWGKNTDGVLGIGSSDNSLQVTADEATNIPLKGVVKVVTARFYGSNIHGVWAIFEDGSVRSWGNNFKGRLGYDDYNNRNEPGPPIETHGGEVKDMCGGYGYSCMLLKDGRVFCWGGYSYSYPSGWPGSPSTIKNTASLPALDFGGIATEISCSENHACVVIDEKVKCWTNRHALGYIGGDSTTAYETVTPSLPYVLGLTKPVVDIATTATTTCAVYNDGNIKCWGKGAAAIGYDTSGTIGDAAGEMDAAPEGDISGVIKIEGGYNHFCALLTGGGMKCWGRNVLNGATGYKNDHNVYLPQNDLSPELGTVVDVMTGHTWSCAILDTGNAKCFGNNGGGQRGDSDTANRDVTEATPLYSNVYDDSYGSMTSIGKGYAKRSSCGACPVNTTRPAGDSLSAATWCISETTCGKDEFMNTNYECQACAAGVFNNPGDNSPGICDDQAVCSENQHVSGGMCISCPANTTNPAGDDTNNGNSYCTLDIPCAQNEYVNNQHQCTSCPSGTYNDVGDTTIGTCDDTEKCTDGYHVKTTFSSDNTKKYGSTPCDNVADCETKCTANATCAGYTSSHKKTIAIGKFGICTLKEGGTVNCWGRNEYGGIGVGDNDLKKITDHPQGAQMNIITSASWIALGETDHTCVIDSGTVKCTGANWYGMIGDGTTVDRTTVISNGITTGVQVENGDGFSCALLADGEVKCWGRNNLGMLGDGSFTERHSPVSTGITDAVQISCGGVHACALLSDKTVKCWGNNHNGQLGIGENGNKKDSPQTVSNLNNVKQVSCGQRSTCALMEDGTATCWGYNGYGQLGDGTKVDINVPGAAIALGGTATKIVTAEARTCALMPGGVKCWGSGYNGYGDTTERLLPDASYINVGGTVVDVDVFNAFVVALLDDDSIKVWGTGYGGYYHSQWEGSWVQDPYAVTATAMQPFERQYGPQIAGTATSFVKAKGCQLCPAGYNNEPMDDPLLDETTCDFIPCAEDQKVVGGSCTACVLGSTRPAGDADPLVDTYCFCGINQHVVDRTCTECPTGGTRPAGDDESGANTECLIAPCAKDYHVVSGACVPCPTGFTNDAGDTNEFGDTFCDATFVCLENQYVSNNQCEDCTVGTAAYGADPGGPDTVCVCGKNEYFDGSACQSCSYGTFNDAGSPVDQVGTCDGIDVCETDEHVSLKFVLHTGQQISNGAGYSSAETDFEKAKRMCVADQACKGLTKDGADYYLSDGTMSANAAYDAYLIYRDEYMCAPCGGTGSRVAGDVADTLTSCSFTTCAAEEAVEDFVCTPCTGGKIQPTPLNPVVGNQACYTPPCLENEYASGGACVACPTDATNEAGDLPDDGDTVCDFGTCGKDEYVSSHACVSCVQGEFNDPGDWRGADSTCDDIELCDANEYAASAYSYNADTNKYEGSSCSDSSDCETKCTADASCAGYTNNGGGVEAWGDNYYGGSSPGITSDVVDIVSNNYAFAALKNDGSVAVWGASGMGGDDPSITAGVSKIYSNKYAFSALKEDGSVQTWGDSPYGGNDPGIGAGSGIVDIFSTEGAFAGLKTNGGVLTWGHNSYGGGPSGIDGHATAAHMIAVKIVPSHSCFAALLKNGEVTVWGSNNCKYPSPPASAQSGVVDITTVARSGADAYAALKDDGSVVAWGNSDSGGTDPGITSGVTKIFSNDYAFAALKTDGSVQVWGDSTNGGSDPGITSGVVEIFSTPKAFAALKSDGSVVAWGDSGYGGTDPGITSGVTKIFSSERAFAALKSDGSVVAWGAQYYGGTDPSITSGVVDISSSKQAFAAIMSDGSVQTWGHPSRGGQDPGIGAGSGTFKIVSTAEAFAAIVNPSLAYGPLIAGTGDSKVKQSSGIACTSCPGAGTNPAARVNESTACTFPDCQTDQYSVGDGVCLACPAGRSMPTPVNPTKASKCLCATGERAVNGSCVACPSGFTNVAGDSTCDICYDTGCDFIPCAKDQYVVGTGYDMVCTPCTAGTFSPGGTVTECGALEYCDIDEKTTTIYTSDTNKYGGNSCSDTSDCETKCTANATCAGYTAVTQGMSKDQTISNHQRLTVCVVLQSGKINCVGEGSYGQLGNGASSDSTTSVEVSGITNAVSVGAGYDHACALLSDGKVNCWGRNNKGQLGQGDTTDSTTPVEVSGITTAIGVSSGYWFSCAVLSDGKVNCWGWGGQGRLGDDSWSQQNTPVEVSGITNAIQVSCGGTFACALLSDGKVNCWGNNPNGNLGDGTTNAAGAPVEVSGITDAVYIDASTGDKGACAVLSDGSAKCWGINQYGELGDGTTTARHTPVDFPAGGSVISISIGHGTTCAVLSDGKLMCAGYKSGLGTGATSNSNTPVEASITNVAQVSCGDSAGSVVALLADGTTKYWGQTGIWAGCGSSYGCNVNTIEDLGITNVKSPFLIAYQYGPLVAGTGNSFVKSGQCVACPDGYENQYGNTTLKDGPEGACIARTCSNDEYSDGTVCLPCPQYTGAASAGLNPTLGETQCVPTTCQTDEHVVNNVCTPCDADSYRLAGDQIYGGDTHCFCKDNQKVINKACVACEEGSSNPNLCYSGLQDHYCVCHENYHVVSNLCTACPAGATRAAGDYAGNGDTHCFCGENQRVVNNECVACPAGTTKPAGDDSSGPDTECSCEENEHIFVGYVTDTNKYEGTSCSDEADCETKCTADATCAGYSNNGASVEAWGHSDNGGTAPAGLSGVTKISSNDYAVAAIKTDGSVTVWGQYDSAVDPGITSGVVDIASTDFAFAAIKSDGTVQAWGQNGYGGTAPAGLTDVTKIFTNNNAFAALKSDGSVVAWGASSTGCDGMTNVVTIVSTDQAFAALKTNGAVHVCGSSSYGGSNPNINSGVTKIFSTQNAFAALKTDGSVQVWGDSTNGGTDPGLTSGVTDIVSTESAFAALKSDGSVKAWGYSDYGGTDPGIGSGVTKIFSTARAFAALKDDGSVQTWGNSNNGGTDPGIGAGSGITDIFSNNLAFAALKSDGSVQVWGNSGYGGTDPGITSGVTTIFSTMGAFAALKDDGSVKAWGAANYGGTDPGIASGVSTIFSNAHAFFALTNPSLAYGPLVAGTGDSKALQQGCQTCPTGSIRAAGDLLADGATSCACPEDYHASNGECVACVAGTRAAGDDPSVDTHCSCLEDHRVQDNVCTACSEGQERLAGDDAGGNNTACSCKQNYSSTGSGCAACPTGAIIGAGSDPSVATACTCSDGYEPNGAGCDACAATEQSGFNTSCVCKENHHYDGSACVACPVGSIRAAGDDKTNVTVCEAVICAENQRVLNNECVNCLPGKIRAAGDEASGIDTVCTFQGTSHVVSTAGLYAFRIDTLPNNGELTIRAGETHTFYRASSGDPFRIVSEADCEGKECNKAQYTTLPSSSLGISDAEEDVAVTVFTPDTAGLYYYLSTETPYRKGRIVVEWSLCTITYPITNISSSCELSAEETLTGDLSIQYVTQSLRAQQGDVPQIKAAEGARHFTVSGGFKLSLNDVDLNGGRGTEGGSILIDNGEIDANNVKFTDNVASLQGGAIRVKNAASKVTLSNILFEDNQGTEGGAIAADALTEPVEIHSSDFKSNRAASGDGGAIKTDTVVNITGTNFEANLANSGEGGGISTSKDITISGSSFKSNRALQGGALKSEDNTVTMSNMVVEANEAVEDGGAFLAKNSEFDVRTSTILANKAKRGAAFKTSFTGCTTDCKKLRIRSSSLEGNEATLEGGAVDFDAEANAEPQFWIQDTEMKDNKARGEANDFKKRGSKVKIKAIDSDIGTIEGGDVDKVCEAGQCSERADSTCEVSATGTECACDGTTKHLSGEECKVHKVCTGLGLDVEIRAPDKKHDRLCGTQDIADLAYKLDDKGKELAELIETKLVAEGVAADQAYALAVEVFGEINKCN